MVRIGQCIPVIESLGHDTAQVGEETTASDESGSIRVVLGPDGIPQVIQVDQDWRRKAGAEGLAAAVSRACARAHEAYESKQTIAIDSSDWPRRAIQVIEYLAGDGPPPQGLEAVPPPPAPVMWSASMIDRYAAAWDGLASGDELVRRTEREYTGDGAAGRVTLTLAIRGPVICDADPDWLRRSEAQEIEQGLSAALAALRADVAADKATEERLMSTYYDALASLPGAHAFFRPPTSRRA
jgi:hypothetical protein